MSSILNASADQLTYLITHNKMFLIRILQLTTIDNYVLRCTFLYIWCGVAPLLVLVPCDSLYNFHLNKYILLYIRTKESLM